MRVGYRRITSTQALAILFTTTSLAFLAFDFAFDFKCGISKQFSFRNSLLYIFAHANIFHLALNLWALWSFKPRLKTCIVAYIVSVGISIIPFIHLAQPTCGLSGFLLACFARKYQSHRIKPWRIILINVAFIPFPMFNWKLHLAAFFTAYAYYYLEQKITNSLIH